MENENRSMSENMLTRDEALLLRNGICSFDSDSGVSEDELAECAEDVVALVKESLRAAESQPRKPNDQTDAPIGCVQ